MQDNHSCIIPVHTLKLKVRSDMSEKPVLRKNVFSYLPQVKDPTKNSRLTDHEMFLPFVDKQSPERMDLNSHTQYRLNARKNGQSYIKSKFKVTGKAELSRMTRLGFLERSINTTTGEYEYKITEKGLQRCQDFFYFVEESDLL
jgi:hypothetical protein